MSNFLWETIKFQKKAGLYIQKTIVNIFLKNFLKTKTLTKVWEFLHYENYFLHKNKIQVARFRVRMLEFNSQSINNFFCILITNVCNFSRKLFSNLQQKSINYILFHKSNLINLKIFFSFQVCTNLFNPKGLSK